MHARLLSEAVDIRETPDPHRIKTHLDGTTGAGTVGPILMETSRVTKSGSRDSSQIRGISPGTPNRIIS